MSEATHDPPEEQAKKYPIQQSAAFAGSTFALASLVDVLAHLGPTGLLVSGLAGYVAWRHGPELYAYVQDRLREALPSASTQVSEQEPAHTQGRNLLDRTIGRFPVGSHQHEERVPQEDHWDERWYDDDEEEVVVAPVSSSLFLFSQVLDSGFVPSLQRIFLGQLPDGTDVVVAAKDLCHVALAGTTGGGKGVLMRTPMAQLCAIGVPVLLLNPHYMRYDRESDEDWTPFEPYLQQPPLAAKSYEQIDFYLHWMAFTLLPKRIERCAKGGRVGKPYFIVLDELPSIVAEIKHASRSLAKILREGRKYGIFLISASQDFLVKTLASDGEGAIRKCYRTAYYVGGDSVTARVLLNLPLTKIPENQLGKGTAMLRRAATREAVVVHVPYVDNASLYRLLGPSTYIPSETEGDSLEEEGLLFSTGRQTGSAFRSEDASSRPPTLASRGSDREPSEDLIHLKEPPEGPGPSECALKGQSRASDSHLKAETASESRPRPDQVRSMEDVERYYQQEHEDIVAAILRLSEAKGGHQHVTREEIMRDLGWSNYKHPIVRVVCDRYKIALPTTQR